MISGVVLGRCQRKDGGEWDQDGRLTFSLGNILRAMEALRELSFLGRLSSMVRTP